MVERSSGSMGRHLLIYLCVVLLFSSILSVGLSSHADSLKQKDKAPKFPDKTVLEEVPYVWQRTDGFCAYATLTSIFQYYDRNMTFEESLAVSGASWGCCRIRSGNNWRFISGTTLAQTRDYDHAADSYGLKMGMYYSDMLMPEGSAQEMENTAEKIGIETHVTDTWSESKSALKSNLQNGTPVLLSIDPAYLPHSDYEGLQAGTSGHGIVAIGYSSEGVKVMDPAIGVIGGGYGRPTREEATYWVGYEDFREGWENRYYLANTFKPSGDKKNIEKRVIQRAKNKMDPSGDLTGVYPSQLAPYSLGYEAYKDLGDDFQPESFKALLESWQSSYPYESSFIQMINSTRTSMVKLLSMSNQSLAHGMKGLDEIVKEQPSAMTSLKKGIEGFRGLSDKNRLISGRGSDGQTLIDHALFTVIEGLKGNSTLEDAVDSASPYLLNISDRLDQIGSRLKNFSAYLNVPESDIQIESMEVSKSKVQVGENLTVSLYVHNYGEINGTTEVLVRLNDEVVAKRYVSVQSGENKTVRLNVSKDEPGGYTVNVGELQEDIEVEKKEEKIIPVTFLAGVIAAVAVSVIMYFVYHSHVR